MATNYKQQATQEYDASYNQKVQGLKNQLAQNQQTLDQQKGGINANYDTQVSNQNLSNKKSKNNLSNTMLGRGLANSSIVVSGLAESDQINNRQVGAINNQRTGALNDLEQQKALLAQNMQGTLGTMSADRLDGITTLSRQLEDRDFDKNHQTSQLDLQRQQMLADQEYKNLSLAQQKELSNSQLAWDREKHYSSLSASQSSASNTTDDAYNEMLGMYAQIQSSDMTTMQKRNAYDSLRTEATMYSAKYGKDYSDILGALNNKLKNSNGVTSKVTSNGITRKTK